MKIKVKPEDATKITVVPSEDEGFVCALLIENEFVNATLRMTVNDVLALVALLSEFLGD